MSLAMPRFLRDYLHHDLAPVHRLCQSHSIPGLNAELYARMIDSWWAGNGQMPDYLGLDHESFSHLVEHHFPGLALSPLQKGRTVDPERNAEREELQELLFATAKDAAALIMARVVAVGCLGENHLWQDLGLWSRRDVSLLIQENFPALAAANIHDMKWKKFFYRQICERAKIALCRAPSCAECGDYHVCFGPEER